MSTYTSHMTLKQKISFYWWHYKTRYNPKNIYYRFLDWHHIHFQEHRIENIPEYGDIYSMEEFKANCDCGGFINDDGFAHPIINDMMDGDIIIMPSQIKKGKYINKYESVVWFNR